MWQERPHCSIIYYYNNYVTLLREIHQVYIEGEALEEMLTMWTPMVTIIILYYYIWFSAGAWFHQKVQGSTASERRS